MLQSFLPPTYVGFSKVSRGLKGFSLVKGFSYVFMGSMVFKGFTAFLF